MSSGHTRFSSSVAEFPAARDGSVSSTFTDQCRQVWSNVVAQLAAANMAVGNLMKVMTFLADHRDVADNRDICNEVLGGHRPALTVVIAGIFEEG
jgi:2-iminobutanoate/2-iminopropanoate deaminase